MRSLAGFVALVLVVAAMAVMMPARAEMAGGAVVQAAVAGGMSLRPDADLVQQVQSRGCRSCRRECYVDFRINCGYSDRCRRMFTQCMRDCWEQICR